MFRSGPGLSILVSVVCMCVAWVYLTKVNLINSGDPSFVHAIAVGRTLSLAVILLESILS